MNRADVLELYCYDEWANARILASLEPLPSEVFTRDLGGSFPSLRDAFAHVVAGEWIWLERWLGNSPTSAPDWLSSPELPVLAGRLHEIEARRRTFLEALWDEDLDRSVTFRFLNGREDEQILRDLLVHVVQHSTYHRGQIADKLRRIGSAAQPTDFIAFKAALRAPGS